MELEHKSSAVMMSYVAISHQPQKRGNDIKKIPMA